MGSINLCIDDEFKVCFYVVFEKMGVIFFEVFCFMFEYIVDNECLLFKQIFLSDEDVEFVEIVKEWFCNFKLVCVMLDEF